jgi:hypothetical protein
MTYQCVYTLINNSSLYLKAFDLTDLVHQVEGQQVVDIEAETEYEFYGNDMNFERIQANMKAKCFELGVPNDKTGVYLTIHTVPPTEIEE